MEEAGDNNIMPLPDVIVEPVLDRWLASKPDILGAMASADANEAYQAWLSGTLPNFPTQVVPVVPVVSVGTGGTGDKLTVVTVVNAAKLSANPNRTAGHRAVLLPALLKKVSFMATARTWRPWDTAVVAKDSMTGTQLYVKFHHRAVALHALLYAYFSMEEGLPQWLGLMAANISLHDKGTLARVDDAASVALRDNCWPAV
jgi:hypothetical protein